MSKLSKALIAAAGNSGGAGLTVEDVFSTYLYTGNGSTQTITNGIDLDGEGGLVWIKNRSGASYNHALYDTNRGAGKVIYSSLTSQEYTASSGRDLTSFNSDGFSLGIDQQANVNPSGLPQASWTFRKAEKFFDVVTYTGNKDSGGSQTISHNLGVAPAVIITKCLSTSAWAVYHASNSGESTPQRTLLKLNETASYETDIDVWNNTAPTDSVFSVGNSSYSNIDGQGYVAYLFASDAGGFGDDDESIIKCGSYVGNGSYLSVDCGFEAQWVLIKRTDSTGSWIITDAMRGMTVKDSDGRYLYPNLSNAEATTIYAPNSEATGFSVGNSSGGGAFNTSGATYIYIAIRRPMKTPESGTEVFDVDLSTTNLQNGTELPSTPFATDMVFSSWRDSNYSTYNISRLTGGKVLYTHTTGSESSSSFFNFGYDQDVISCTGNFDSTSSPRVNYAFKRATGFFDVVCYEGVASSGNGFLPQDVDHNLVAVPEMMIVKCRSTGGTTTYRWHVYHKDVGNTQALFLNESSVAGTGSAYWNNTTPTDSVFSVGGGYGVNEASQSYIAYLFASLAGVSKVGSYTGNGTSLTVDCGFSNGARFVLIKRTNSAGMWMVFDTARGIVAGNDPVLYLNSTAAEFSGADLIDPNSSGFTVNWAFSDLDSANPNASGSTYIFLAIA